MTHMISVDEDLLESLCASDVFNIRFGKDGYWIKDEPEQLSYGTMLTALLNKTCSVDGTLAQLQTQYVAFLDKLYSARGRKGESLILRACAQAPEQFQAGIRHSRIEIQYEVIRISDHETELVEAMRFYSIRDFLYVELLKGLQKGFIPKRCLNCGRWFLQTPGPACSYCSALAPGETERTCREVGAASGFRFKVRNNEVWRVHQRAYKKYFARTKKNTMSKRAFADWVVTAERLRDEALKAYAAAGDLDRNEIVEGLRMELNRI